MEREPCPYRIIDDVGGAFAMGGIGGSIWHFIQGIRNAPKGARFRGGIFRAKSRAPILGGSFAVWGMCFASFDCSFAAIRMKEDPWNGIISGFCTGGLLSLRAGPKVAMRSAVAGGVILAVFEGIGIALNKYLSPSMDSEQLLATGAEANGMDRVEYMKILNDPKDITTPPPPTGYGSFGKAGEYNTTALETLPLPPQYADDGMDRLAQQFQEQNSKFN